MAEELLAIARVLYFYFLSVSVSRFWGYRRMQCLLILHSYTRVHMSGSLVPTWWCDFKKRRRSFLENDMKHVALEETPLYFY
jgi:hypothetical protein